jgi:hypothetical protein
MADNVTLPGASEVIATDDIGTVQYQRIKITDGTPDSTLHLQVVAEDQASANGDTGLIAMAVRQDVPGTATNANGDYEPLQVSGGRLWVSPLGFPVTVQADITRQADVAAYAVNDALSNSTTAPTPVGGFQLINAARRSGGSLLITDVVVTSSANPATMLQGEVFFFNQAVTQILDNAAFSVSDSEIKTCIGRVGFALENVGGNGFFHATNLNILATLVGSADLRFLVRVRNAYTPVSGEVITVTIKAIQLD